MKTFLVQPPGLIRSAIKEYAIDDLRQHRLADRKILDVSRSPRPTSIAQPHDRTAAAIAQPQSRSHSHTLFAFLSYTQRDPEAKLIASELYHELQDRSLECWLDVKMHERDEAAMEAGVQNAECLIAIFTNNGKDSYLSRKFCRQEILWAERYHKPIVAVVSRDDKKNVGKFVEEGMRYGLDFSKIDFKEYIRSSPEQTKTSLDVIVTHVKAWGDRERPQVDFTHLLHDAKTPMRRLNALIRQVSPSKQRQPASPSKEADGAAPAQTSADSPAEPASEAQQRLESPAEPASEAQQRLEERLANMELEHGQRLDQIEATMQDTRKLLQELKEITTRQMRMSTGGSWRSGVSR